MFLYERENVHKSLLVEVGGKTNKNWNKPSVYVQVTNLNQRKILNRGVLCGINSKDPFVLDIVQVSFNNI